MSSRFSTTWSRAVWVGGVGLLLVLLVGCDAVPGRTGERSRPTVSNLQMVTNGVEVMEDDSLAQLDVTIAVRAADEDGSIERVVFTIEPAANPRGTVNGELSIVDGPLYGGRVQFTVPLVEEIYTVRVFAVDDDELASNQVTGQLEFDRDAHTSGQSASTVARTAQISVSERP